jgi:hypothetical protein
MTPRAHILIPQIYPLRDPTIDDLAVSILLESEQQRVGTMISVSSAAVPALIAIQDIIPASPAGLDDVTLVR